MDRRPDASEPLTATLYFFFAIFLTPLLGSCRFLPQPAPSSEEANHPPQPSGISSWLSMRACDATTINLRTPVGDEPLVLKRRPEGETGFTLELAGKSWPLEGQDLLREEGCNASEQGLALVHKKVQELLPLCKTLTPKAPQTLECHLAIEPTSASRRLDDIIQSVSREIKPAPYLLSRRMSIAQLFESAFMEGQNDEKRQIFCSLTSNALSEELPLILQSPAWLEALCRKSNQDATLRTIAFNKMREEFAAYGKLMQSALRSGHVTLHYKATESSSRPLFQVRITPQGATAARYIDQLTALQTSSAPSAVTTEEETASRSLCWFPGFGPQNQGFLVGSALGLWGSCATISESQKVAVGESLISVTAGELDFKITSGQGKAIKLPQGAYQYTVEEVFSHLDRVPFRKNLDSGTMDWNEKVRNISLKKNP
jgi:hypothetical protein